MELRQYDPQLPASPQTISPLSQRHTQLAGNTTFNLNSNPNAPQLPKTSLKITMVLPNQLSDLIGDIHDAALDASLWSEVVGKAGRFVGGPAAAIFSKNAGSGDVHYEFGTDPHYRELYFEKYVNLDPATSGHHQAEIGDAMAVEDLMPYPEFTQTQFYREWARPQGIVDFLSAVLDKSADGAALFGVFRYESDGIVDDAARRRMRLVVPHIRRAVLLGRALEGWSGDAAALDVLNGFKAGVCLLDASGKIIHVNSACKAILAAGDMLFSGEGRIVARDPAINDALRELLAGGSSEPEIPRAKFALPLRATDGARYVMHASALSLPAVSTARMPAAVALFIHRAAIETTNSPDVIAEAYRLTPTELRVLLAITEIGGVAEAGAALGVADTTIKTHLGRLFLKTRARRQADLIKIVAGFTSPFGGAGASARCNVYQREKPIDVVAANAGTHTP
jgi:DNA-binding CsgD family transcriptional regulator